MAPGYRARVLILAVAAFSIVAGILLLLRDTAFDRVFQKSRADKQLMEPVGSPVSPKVHMPEGSIVRSPTAVSSVETDGTATPSSLEYVLDHSVSDVDRLKVVDTLPKQQAPEITASLTQLLKSRDEDEALRNNVASKLRECGDPNLVSDLTTMLWDEKETPKWRNYCVQHLYQCYEDKPDPSILATLFKATEAGEKMVRICAVWSLALIAAPRYGNQPPDKATTEKIRTVALGALKEKDADFLITTSGVQSCARLGLKEALPDIRALASSNNTKPTSLRIAAVAALGDLKDTESIPLLERLSKEATGQLQSAAQLALKRINEAKGRGETTASPEPEAGKTSSDTVRMAPVR